MKTTEENEIQKPKKRLVVPRAWKTLKPARKHSEETKAKIRASKLNREKVKATGKLPNGLPSFPKSWKGQTRLECQRIISKLFQAFRKFKKKEDDYFIQFHSEELSSVCDDYRKYVDWLIKVKVLQVKEPYQFNQKGRDPKNLLETFCKKYKFTASYAWQKSKELIKFEFSFMRKSPERLKLANKPIKETKYVKAMMDTLQNHITIDQTFIHAGLTEWDYDWLERLNYKILRVVEGKSGRVYDNVTFMSEDARKYILIDGEKTVQVDYSSLHPFLLSKYISDSKEKYLYETILKSSTGLYGWIMETVKTDNRDYSKTLYQIWLSQDEKPRGKAKILMAEMSKRFPILTKFLKKIKDEQTTNEGETIQAKLQGDEAKVVVQKLFMNLKACGIPTLTIHDCILCKKNDAGLIAELMESEAKKAWGIEVKTKTK